jgi:hypothetical protein
VLERADKVMSLEREIKRAQLTLLIRLKNLLTPEQMSKPMPCEKRNDGHVSFRAGEAPTGAQRGEESLLKTAERAQGRGFLDRPAPVRGSGRSE